jgi:hypothetical protein
MFGAGAVFVFSQTMTTREHRAASPQPEWPRGVFPTRHQYRYGNALADSGPAQNLDTVLVRFQLPQHQRVLPQRALSYPTENRYLGTRPGVVSESCVVKYVSPVRVFCISDERLRSQPGGVLAFLFLSDPN